MERLDAAHTLEVLRARATRIDRLVLDVVGRVTDAQVTEPVRRIEAAAGSVTPGFLGRVTGVRGRPVSGVLEMWWREAGVHVADLDLGVDHTAWDADLCEHLFGYLEPRVRPGTQLELV